jgi:signal transduction histidine kinase
MESDPARPWSQLKRRGGGDSGSLRRLETAIMVVLRTRIALVFGGIAALALSAVVALRAGASAWATGLLGAQIIFAGVFLFRICACVRRRLEALKKQVEAGGPVVAEGECAELGRSLGSLIEAHRAAMAARQQQLTVMLEAETRARRGAETLIDALPHGIALLSPAGRVDLVNSRAAWFGLVKDQSVDAAPHAWLKTLLARALETRQSAGLADHPGGGPDWPGNCREGLVQMFEEGRELFFLPQAYPLIDAQGALTGVVMVLADVTASRKAGEARDNLLASFSHEIRTPMTSLQMSIYLLLDDAASRLTPRQLELLQAARDDSDRLHRIVEDALARKKA